MRDNRSMHQKKKQSNRIPGILRIVILLAVFVLLLVLFAAISTNDRHEKQPQPSQSDKSDLEQEPSSGQGPDSEAEPEAPETEKPMVEDVDLSQWESESVFLEKGLEITDVGNYTGIYMEDGTDEIVSGVLMLVVKNNNDQSVQYAEITMPTSDGDAFFTLTTLPAGSSIVLLEKNRMMWSENEDYSEATVDNVAFFAEELSLCEDQVDIMVLDGAMNVTNISGEDIEDIVSIYYKNAAADLYYGGITYRVRIEGGIRAGEIKQIMADHFYANGSKIMFVTVG